MKFLLIAQRKQFGLKRQEIADLLGISYSTVAKVEKGTRRASPDLAKRWSAVLNIAPNEIFNYFF